MTRRTLLTILPAAGLLLGSSAGTPAPRTRTVEADYVATVPALPAGAHHVEIWVPVPSDRPLQSVSGVKVEGPGAYTLAKDSAGNSVAHFTLEGDASRPETTVHVRFRVERKEAVSRAATDVPDAAAKKDLLSENALVRVTPRVRALAKEIAEKAKASDPLSKAKAFYEYLVTNGTYDKTTPGWGRGDSERFCDLKKGNCTDFHSMFMALARAEGIPVRFVMGFPLKPEKEGTVPGYHCWAEFFVEGRGWIPVDPSEASKTKDQARRDYLFGNLDPDRFEVTRGRDLWLAPRQKEGPLNLFIAPYVEVDGKAFGQTSIKLEYKDV
ncbi:MAG TPA: transglutaminase domain-containing protein [Thermoanaerobaculia bacterium]|nr:transglutaminase domain-containing protein [Thermoanaerobaculia bacterium]